MTRTSFCRWSHSNTVVLIWVSSAIIFFLVFHMALDNSLSSSRLNQSSDPGYASTSAKQRSALYEKMARDLDEHGASFLQGGATSQSLSISDIFSFKDDSVIPILKAADPPVRATVLYLYPESAKPISDTVKSIFMQYFGRAIWFQNASLYHFSMFHASHHLEPVTATPDEIEAEGNAIKAVAEVICPLKIILDRVVLTSTGVLLGCWQEKHMHSDQLKLFQDLVERANQKLKGFEATISELWFVEEFDVLALALNGRMKVRKFDLICSNG
ncbi:uncharacterized protein LOC18421942 isoform X2 [Amborella trichopoda]|uniref:uncharacterized protein LOC18421942 isoform X2 n=1 Tax=Amborella trichopoda TaxID=13333 RepID=UPI0009BD808A|nr:uncharacterized protein LOC18421942 isoform X2 [Amborella trichopoda]|eukprot:XP_020522552.1 uncharacterized protein LOC18421942 isoform X2 [Amborella trichopoda]